MIAEVMKSRLLRYTYPICLPSHGSGLTQGLRHSTRPSTGNQTAFGLLNPANLVLFVSEDFRLSRATVVSCLKIRLW